MGVTYVLRNINITFGNDCQIFYDFYINILETYGVTRSTL